MWIYVLGHELTHALWTWLFGGKVKKMKVSSSGGHVVISKTNFFIALAPYFFPLYAVIVVAVFATGHLIWDWKSYLVFFPSARWRGVCVSRHADILHFENAANRHHIAGVFVFGGGHLSRQCVRFAIWNPAAHGEGWIIQRTRLAV